MHGKVFVILEIGQKQIFVRSKRNQQIVVKQFDVVEKQAIITLRGIAELRFSNVYNYQQFSLLWYLCFLTKRKIEIGKYMDDSLSIPV